jgi:hypothetical protein
MLFFKERRNSLPGVALRSRVFADERAMPMEGEIRILTAHSRASADTFRRSLCGKFVLEKRIRDSFLTERGGGSVAGKDDRVVRKRSQHDT